MQHKISINNGWRFIKLPNHQIKDSGKIIIDENKCEEVTLPHTLYSEENPYRGLVCYRRRISLEPEWKHAFIDVPAADRHAVVLINGEKIAEHKGGYSAFRGEVPAKLVENPEVTEVLLEIFVTNASDPEISPLTGDFTIFGGLYRGVNLLATGSDSYFDPQYYGTDGVILRCSVQDIHDESGIDSTDSANESIAKSGITGREETVGRIEVEVHGYFEPEDRVVLEVFDAEGNRVSVGEIAGIGEYLRDKDINSQTKSSGKILSEVTENNVIDAESSNFSEEDKGVCGKSLEADILTRDEVSMYTGARTVFLSVSIPSPHLWNGKSDPYLYTVRTRLIKDENIVDEKVLKTGFRKVSITPDKGLFLNGRHLRIRGVAKHQDFCGKYNAVTDSDIQRDFELIDEIGANAVRLSHYQHPQYTYELTDEKGYLVWAEIPMLKMTENQELFRNAEEQLKELVLQNIHHPAIFCWGIQNEIGMFRDSQYMYEELGRLRDIAKKLDPSRLVTGANLYTVKFRSGLNSGLDMVGYNVYFGWYYGHMKDYSEYLDRFHAERPEVPVGMSEYGVDANIAFHSEEPMIRDYSEEYQALYHETVYPIFESKDYLFGSFVWNMFDFSSSLRKEGGQMNLNAKGLVTYDRKNRKDAFYYYKARWSEEKFLHICSQRFEKRAKNAIDIKVYTNCESVSLSLNGKEIGTERNDGNGRIIFRNVPLVMGRNEVEAVMGEPSVKKSSDTSTEILRDSCVFERVTEEEESYRLPDSGAGTAVKNWFLSDDDIVREGFCSIKDSANDLLENPDSKVVLEKHLPKLVEFMLTKDMIPLGLSLESILSRNTPEGLDITRLNKELNEVPAMM